MSILEDPFEDLDLSVPMDPSYRNAPRTDETSEESSEQAVESTSEQESEVVSDEEQSVEAASEQSSVAVEYDAEDDLLPDEPVPEESVEQRQVEEKVQAKLQEAQPSRYESRTAFSVMQGSQKVSTVRAGQMPEVVISRLRSMISDATGDTELASEVSFPALMTGYFMVALDLDFNVDSNTRAVVDAFRAGGGEMTELRDAMKASVKRDRQLVMAINDMRKQMRLLSVSAEASAMMQSYLVADQVVGLSTVGQSIASLDLTPREAKQVRARVESTAEQMEKAEYEKRWRLGSTGRDN